MTFLQSVAMLVSIVIVCRYFVSTKSGEWWAFHLANALGAPVLIAAEIEGGAWGVVPVTFSFGLVGVLGVLYGER